MTPRYYVPATSYWPIIGAIGLFFFAAGTVNLLHGNNNTGWGMFLPGSLLIVGVMFGWFANSIAEAQQGLHSPMVARSYRWGMIWFIFSEVMFFAAFFGALFYARVYAVPWLGGLGHGDATHALLWPHFQATWPLFKNPNPELFPGPDKVIGAWGIPALNTVLLLSSAVTLTWAHWALKNRKREVMIFGLTLTIVLGLTFLGCQVYEYILAHHHYGLTLSSGIYGTTFFMLTGFHGAHVTIGLIMLMVILARCLRGHFDEEHHFAFEASAWYWHFVDVVWLFLFVFVYWL
ncbi:MAG: cytochrome c oxidase subunit 3 [Legionellales bacterium]|nr:cytochrome c oxidase subunit 3 [Legionellales bacterium]|tara:strand:+ start:5657 stop:6526 length:870 start_codon:yes stop_codon:yes gene_type:complete